MPQNPRCCWRQTAGARHGHRARRTCLHVKVGSGVARNARGQGGSKLRIGHDSVEVDIRAHADREHPPLADFPRLHCGKCSLRRA